MPIRSLLLEWWNGECSLFPEEEKPWDSKRGFESISYSKIVNAKFICAFNHDTSIRTNAAVMRSHTASTLQNECWWVTHSTTFLTLTFPWQKSKDRKMWNLLHKIRSVLSTNKQQSHWPYASMWSRGKRRSFAKVCMKSSQHQKDANN